MTNRELFLNYCAQTSEAPLALEITKAKDCYLYDQAGTQYIDLIGGISVCNVGHCNEAVVQAIQVQSEKYLHVMVYGETVQSPQVRYAEWLANHLPETLNSVYFTNSGTEATEGAMKLAKKVTGRTQFISCNNSYHGHTQGALSIMGSEYWKQNYRPLLPDCLLADYNDESILDLINTNTAAIIIEPVQAESGVIRANKVWLQKIRKQCDEKGVLLIFDEIQTGFGRTGTLWAFEDDQIIPDILLLGKALGGGMPLGAFIASKEMMHQFTSHPVLGHLTTFGGHPVCCAAGLAAAQFLTNGDLIQKVTEKESLFREQLQHPFIRNINSKGLLMSVWFESEAINFEVIRRCLSKGLFTDWFLFNSSSLRIAPPLIIAEAQITTACKIIVETLNEM
jgi:acetylornithine/N-succinyldiaminopimelate aminotransferase